MRVLTSLIFAVCSCATPLLAQQTEKPPLHARHWLAITGKPLAATAGALMFAKGGNAVDASCAMLAVIRASMEADARAAASR